MRLKFWTGLFLAALSCSAPDKAADDDKTQDDTVEDGTTPGADADGGVDDDTPDDEHWMTIRARVQVDLYTTDEEGSRQFMSWEDAVGPAGEFPFGSIFVAAVPGEATAVQSTIAQHTVMSGIYERMSNQEKLDDRLRSPHCTPLNSI